MASLFWIIKLAAVAVLVSSVCMSHSFFCSCHGNGPSDAETAVVKTAGRTAEENDVYLAFPVDF